MNDLATERRLGGPSPAFDGAFDMVRRGLPLVPVGVFVGAFFAGFDGAVSVGYGITIVLVNLLLSVAVLSWASKISPAVVPAAALGGYLMRLGLVFVAVLLVKDQSWIAVIPLGLTIILTHLGLLVWELRYVSASLAGRDRSPTA